MFNRKVNFAKLTGDGYTKQTGRPEIKRKLAISVQSELNNDPLSFATPLIIPY